MKKFILSLAVALAVGAAAVSCSNTTSSADESAQALIEKIQSTTNQADIQKYVDQAREYATQLVNEGKIDEAKAYLEKIEPVVKEKAPALAGALEAASNGLDKVKDFVGDQVDAVGAATDDAVQTASDAVESAKDKAGEAVDAAKEQAGQAVDAAKEAAGNILDAAQQSASDAKDAIKGLPKK